MSFAHRGLFIEGLGGTLAPVGFFPGTSSLGLSQVPPLWVSRYFSWEFPTGISHNYYSHLVAARENTSCFYDAINSSPTQHLVNHNHVYHRGYNMK